MRKLATLTAFFIVVLTSSLWAEFNPSSGFLLEPIQKGTEVEFNYVSTYNGLNMTATSPFSISVNNVSAGSIQRGLSSSIEIWFKLDSLNKKNPLVEKIDISKSSFHKGYKLYVSDSNKVKFSIQYGSFSRELTSTIELDDTTWYYLVINHIRKDGVYLYVNSILDVSDTMFSDFLYNPAFVNMEIGKSKLDSTYFTGKITSLRVLDRSLTPTEIISNNNSFHSFGYDYYASLIFKFNSTRDTIIDYSKYSSYGIIESYDSITNAFFSETPSFFEWDINADGTYDTTTSEPTLVYDYGSFDTTLVIVKAVEDSLHYTTDTIYLELFNNAIQINILDTLWTFDASAFSDRNLELKCTPYSLSDDGRMCAFHMNDDTSCGTFLILRDGEIMKDLTGYPTGFASVSPMGNYAVIREDGVYGMECLPWGLVVVDTIGNMNSIEQSISCHMPYITKNDSFILNTCGYSGFNFWDRINEEYIGCDGTFIDLYNAYGSSYMKDTIHADGYYIFRQFTIEENAEYYVLYEDSNQKISFINRGGDIVWSHDSIFSTVDTVLFSRPGQVFISKYLNNIICIRQLNNLEVLCFDLNGNQISSNNFNGFHSDHFDISLDGNYLIGSMIYNNQTGFEVIDLSEMRILWTKDYGDEIHSIMIAYEFPDDSLVIFNTKSPTENKFFDIAGNRITFYGDLDQLNIPFYHKEYHLEKIGNIYRLLRVELQ